MKAIERIYTQADDYGFRVPYDGTNKFYDDSAVKGYIAGATLERNIAIDEAIDIVTDYQDYNPLIIERLKALKV